MTLKTILFLTFLVLFFSTAYTIEKPWVTEVIYNETSLVFKYFKDQPYISRLVMYKDRETQYFDCTLIIDDHRYCVFHSDLPFSRLWGSLESMVCSRDVSSPKVDCLSYRIIDVSYVKPININFTRLPPTSGGDIVINGNFLRFVGGPNKLYNSISHSNPLEVKGDFSYPSFNCNSITVSFPPGSGPFEVYSIDRIGGEYLTSYEPPKISSFILDPSKQIITIDGDNFFTDSSLVQVYFDEILQQNISITISHTQIQVKHFIRTDPGPMSTRITVDQVSTQNNYMI
ncbi:immunoglobulin E-set domain-containing protein [Dictyostelium discoideum AX4]|uniref:Immunoglobulin E-set domain-containing protein n=1 Tax=Dictyostelium discoideum TaxID=44689 RepID=Q55AT6_DICDI|nr:immunoglobulin E-set domain-containing protein [Dictyostelium discoideum AX4]EAL71691.1 immunoglobulin E-set domain-containing protein [Dictyostelium discoideum AX4]|eukprot:XP_645610.1 immunoglobulin E-set domain-containing protein [Dictyostelium discoideum AX4]